MVLTFLYPNIMYNISFNIAVHLITIIIMIVNINDNCSIFLYSKYI